MRTINRHRRPPSQVRTLRARRRGEPAENVRHRDLVLVATEDPDVRHVLCDELDGHGYRPIAAGSATPLDELAAQLLPVLTLLDLDREDREGLALLTRIRERAGSPVIALSMRAAEGDKVAALDAGADDYVTKPFGRLELFARIRVALRYVRALPSDAAILEAGPIRIDAARHVVTVTGRSVHLTPIEFRILASLARGRGAVVTRAQLVHEVWGPGSDQADHVRVHIAALRRKLEANPQRPRWLVTVVGIGYRLGA